MGMLCSVCRADPPSVCESCVNEMRANHKEIADAMINAALEPGFMTDAETRVVEAAVKLVAIWEDLGKDWHRESIVFAAATRALVAAQPEWKR